MSPERSGGDRTALHGETRAMRIHDITLPIDSALACWPGDAAYTLRRTTTIGEGAAVNLSEVSLSLHMGTHADAPWHYDDCGATMDAVALDPFIGPAVVIDVSGREVVRREDIPSARLQEAPRVLLRTNAWTDTTRFPDRIPVMTADLPAYLAAHGVLLLGLDVPSVDALDSKELPLHHALGRHRPGALRNHRVRKDALVRIGATRKIIGLAGRNAVIEFL